MVMRHVGMRAAKENVRFGDWHLPCALRPLQRPAPATPPGALSGRGHSMISAITRPFRNLIEIIAAQNIKSLAFAACCQDMIS
ncbi:hypothetical protein MTR66_00855 [Novosphingobium sp. 2638]|uniref:Uncharacterized protein n=1 Tax=Novosphingobium beihaiensis TaxID=2930389 RepID=A0ABT0BK01_9SPHN|nr:hypothetical protein [Novosphingobium beihaiensis]